MLIDIESPNGETKNDAVIRHERRALTTHLLDIYYTFKGELESHELASASDEKQSAIAKEMIQNFVAAMNTALVIGILDDALYVWARKEIGKREVRAKNKTAVTRDDVAGVMIFLEKFLSRMYHGKTIEEVQNELNQEDEKDAEQEDTFNLIDIPLSKRAEIIHDRAIELYKARYDWGYYPEATRNLKVEKMSLNEAIDARRKQLGYIHFNSNYNKDTNLDFLLQKIRRGKASDEEIELYGLWRNKITAQWIGIVEADVQMLCSLGPEFQKIYNELVKLAERNRQYREEMARHARETRTTEGFIPFGNERLSDEMRKDIRMTEELIERALILLYPSSEIKGKLNREAIEDILGIKKQ